MVSLLEPAWNSDDGFSGKIYTITGAYYAFTATEIVGGYQNQEC